MENAYFGKIIQISFFDERASRHNKVAKSEIGTRNNGLDCTAPPGADTAFPAQNDGRTKRRLARRVAPLQSHAPCKDEVLTALQTTVKTARYTRRVELSSYSVLFDSSGV